MGGSSRSSVVATCEPLCAALGARVASLRTPDKVSALFAPAFNRLWGNPLRTCLFDKSTR